MIRLCFIVVALGFLFGEVIAQTLVITYKEVEIYPPQALELMPELEMIDISYYRSLHIDGQNSMSMTDSIIVHGFMQEGRKIFLRNILYKNYAVNRTYLSMPHLPSGQATIKTFSDQFCDFSQWTFIDQTREILGVSCKLARHKNGSNAWYAPSIPYPDGPSRFAWGFPGLILSTDWPSFSIEAIRLEYRDEPIIIPDFVPVAPKDIPDQIETMNISGLPENDYIIINNELPKGVALTFDKH